MTAGRGFWFGSVGLFAVALGVYGWQASGTMLLNRDLADRNRYLAAIAERPPVDRVAEAAAANVYWQRYPDIADDAYYGRSGPLGILGARQHYGDHGRREGRQWGR